MSKTIYNLNSELTRQIAAKAVLNADIGQVVTIDRVTRAAERRAELYAMLSAISKHVRVILDGNAETFLTPAEWKAALIAQWIPPRELPGVFSGIRYYPSMDEWKAADVDAFLEFVAQYARENGVPNPSQPTE